MARGSEYGRLFERLPLVAYVADLDDRARLRYVSPHVEQVLGYPPADWLGDSALFAERLHPDDRDRVLAVLRSATASDEASAAEFRMIARDGRTVWLADRRVVTERHGGEAFTVGVLEDVTARKDAEQQLASTRRVTAAVLESLEEGLVVLDRNGAVISGNREAARILGVDVGELRATGIHRPAVTPFLEDGTPLGPENSIAMRVLRDGVDEREVHVRLVLPGGGERWVSANYLLLRGDEGSPPQGVIWSLVDITESRRVASALAESERRFRDVVENVQAVFWIRDPKNEKIVYVGPAYEEVWGRPLEVVYRDPDAWLDAVHPDDRAMVRKAAFAGRPDEYDAEYRIIRPDGTIRWIHDRAFATRGSVGRDELVTGMAEDVTEQHETEAALTDARERARAAFLNAPIGSAVVALRGTDPGPVVEANPALCAMLGYPEAELLGSDPNSFLDAGGREEGLALWRSLIAGEVNSYDVERELTRADGRRIWARLRMSLVRDGAGEAMYVVVQAEDITRALRAQAQAAAVAELGHQALSSSGLEELMNDAIQALHATLGASIVGIHEFVEAEGTFAPRAVRLPPGAAAPPLVALEDSAHMRLALDQREPAVIEDWSSETRFNRIEFLTRLGALSTISVPIQGPRGVWGVLTTHFDEPQSFARDDIAFAQAVANVLGAAIHRREAEEETRYRALHDPLTRLPNRTLFLDRLGHALDRADRAGTRVAVLFMDLDHFKVINDSLGHEVGDRLLCEFAPRLTDALRPSDTVARLGGDEFVVLCEDLHSEQDVVHLAERILDCLREPFEIGSHELFTSVTIGLALARRGDAPEGLIRDADAAMYRAKAGGRARYELFDEAMRERVSERLSIETALRRAVADEALSLHFQPIVALADRSIVGAEALLRWKHPERGWISPEQFIPIAEDSGLIVQIGEWVLDEAMRAAMRWPEVRAGGGKPQLAVNLSARQVAQRGFSKKLAAALERTGLPSERLSLEITESVLIEEAEAPVETVRELKRLGIALVLDDFGTGYSSLSYLNRLPIDVLKLDRSFIARLRDRRETSGAIVSGVVTMAEALGITVVAEGVEEASQAEQLRALGCGFAQGFFFARPMPAGDLECLLRARPQMPRARLAPSRQAGAT